ncbi:hypothetical protein CVIRNUC_002648 [Coccomyxa viridis]|uniref:Uncharacterized protein n=1 Tax=Coccomyxa viridis TaxID=1274662 RepID=A0AAV1HZE2_9CHLO|nr:hypothetical protein CVIRNUC_002648 [Coccomyxa viridis]
MICPPAKQSAVVDYYSSRRHVAGIADLLDFTPCDLWPLIRGRTLWIVGDSHTYDLYHAVACLMLDFWDYNYQGARPIDGEEAAFEALSEHVVHSKPPECLPLAEGTMICHFRVNHGQILVGHGLPLLERMGGPTDIALLNFGAWHGSGDGPEFRKLVEDFRDAVADRAGRLPRLIWKEMVPTHYDQQHGLYPGGEPPYECKPLHVALQDDGTLAPTDDWSQIIIEQGQQNRVVREVFAGTDIGMTSFWNATVEMWDFHRDISDGRGHECSHYCFGGVPQVWVYHAYKAISEAHWSPVRTQSSTAGLQE